MGDIWIEVLCSAVVLAGVAVAYHMLEKTRGRNWKAHAIYWAVALLIILLVPTSVAKYVFGSLTLTLVATIFPIYESVRAICTPEEEDDKEWLQYWMVGGVLFILTAYVDDMMKKESAKVIWFECMVFAIHWLFFRKTFGSALIYDYITEPYVAPKVRPLQTKMNNFAQAVYHTLVNAVHLWIIWIIFMFLPATLKRIVTIALGTVYPLVSSITAAATEQVEDDQYWLTYWSCYGCLFLIMEILETWLYRIPGFYTLIIACEIYLMLPMFEGSDKIFRKILVPLFGLRELLMLRDAIQVKKSMLRDLDPERARAVRKAIAKFYDDDDDSADPGELKHEFLSSWKGLKAPWSSSSSEQPTETTPIV